MAVESKQAATVSIAVDQPMELLSLSSAEKHREGKLSYQLYAYYNTSWFASIVLPLEHQQPLVVTGLIAIKLSQRCSL